MATVLDFDTSLLSAFDALGQRFAFLDRFGRLQRATDSFIRELTGPHSEALYGALKDIAFSGWGRRLTQQVPTPGGEYRLHAAHITGDPFGFGQSLLVSIELPPADPLDELRLKREFRLTRAQCRVARLLVQGLRNEEIARTLFLSSHTVRHHVEQIRLKVGGHTRAAVAARLRRAS